MLNKRKPILYLSYEGRIKPRLTYNTPLVLTEVFPELLNIPFQYLCFAVV